MATTPPSKTEVFDAIRTAVKIIHEDYLELVANSEKYTDHETDHRANIQLLDVVLLGPAATGLSGYRSSRVGTYLGATAMLDPIIQQFARVLDVPDEDVGGLLVRLDQSMRDESTPETVAPRGGAFGSPALAGTNTGDGTMIRNTVDRDGYPLESARFNDVITFELDVDANLGTRPGEEVWTFRGDNKGIDLITEDGSGYDGTFPTDSADTSLLENSSFGELDGDSAGSLTTIPSWTIDVGAIGDFTLSTTVHRANNIESTSYSLSFNNGTTSTISQKLTVAGIEISDPDNQPYVAAGWYNNDSGAGGTLTISQGTVSESEVVSGSSTGWVHIYIGKTLDGKNNYYLNWREDDAKIAVKWSGASGFLWDNMYFGIQRAIGDGTRQTYGNIFAGETNWQEDDSITITDTVSAPSAQGILQQHFNRLYDFTFISAASSGAAVIADPS